MTRQRTPLGRVWAGMTSPEEEWCDMGTSELLLEVRGVTKTFPGVRALFSVAPLKMVW